jgi:hypothetical protein
MDMISAKGNLWEFFNVVSYLPACEREDFNRVLNITPANFCVNLFKVNARESGYRAIDAVQIMISNAQT